MSVYNAEDYLKESVESILNQTYKDFEFIIYDDASTDNSRTILEKYKSLDNRLCLHFNTKNEGLTKNLNLAIKQSQGGFIARMDADDICDPERLEKQLSFLNTHPEIDILGTFCEDINEKGKIIGKRAVPVTHEEVIKTLPKLNPISHPTVMFRKTALNKLSGYNEKYRILQDYNLWFRAAAAGLKFHNIPEFLVQYRMNLSYVKRKSFRYRFTDIRLRIEGYKKIKLPFYKYFYAFIPLFLSITPPFLYKILKKIDPRSVHNL